MGKEMEGGKKRVSVHGGHSGQFCLHAADSLEEIVRAYIDNGFVWVGITEHMPPSIEDIIYPEEKQAGMGPVELYHRFGKYILECRRLQVKYSKQITLLVGLETENYPGYERQVLALREEFQPDYIVGSIHHLDTIPIDYSEAEYERAAREFGGIDKLYCRYFDEQYSMLQAIRPAVVGHFDLIRIYDAHYTDRLQRPKIMARIKRNLDFIGDCGLILDYNLRALNKGAKEPYVSEPILHLARQRGIAVVPGDDSHGVKSIGVNIDGAMRRLAELGFDTDWRMPAGAEESSARAMRG
ncbi:MAG: histidinol-phosphatase [Desulfocapsaceae bacterium]|nr:histidinol-phosphatase [Desulfocapsaceae bacterium]